MRLRDILHISLLVSISIAIVYGCEMYRFVATDNGQALEGHVIKTITKPLVNFCWSDCVWLPWCFSINVRQNDDGIFECELNNSSKKANPSKMVSRKGWSLHQMTGLSRQNCKVYECKRKEDLGNGWRRYGDRAIKLFTEKKNWTDARSHCQSLGGDLLSITSSHENDFVNDVFVENLNLTYMQEDKKFTLSHIHFKLNGEETKGVLTGDVQYQISGREKALYLDGQKQVDMPSIYLNPKGFTLLFWMKAAKIHVLAHVLKFIKDGIVNLRIRFGDHVNYLNLAINGTRKGELSYESTDWQFISFSWANMTARMVFGKNGVLESIDTQNVASIDTSNILLRFGKRNQNFHGFFKHFVLVNGSIPRHKMQTIMYWHEQGVWIGLNNPGGSADFSWSDGTPVGQFMNLPDYNPVPTVTLRKCVAMAKDKKWLDKHCDLKYQFLCEKPAPT